MSNKTLFQEAIADAKAVREAALANAKAALEETMTPRLQSMIAARLEENYDDTDEETYEEGMYPDETTDDIQDRYRATGAALEEELDDTDHFYTQKKGKVTPGISNPFSKSNKLEPGSSDPYIDEELDEQLDLSAILAELETESQLEEAKKKGKEEDEETEDEEAETEETEEDETPDEEEAEPTKVKDMTDEELIDLIKDIVKQEIEAEEEEQPSDEAGEPEHGGMDMNPMGTEPAQAGNEEEVNINELLAELEEMYGNEEKEEESMKYEAKKAKVKQDEMKEALSVINTLRSELNEVNLLNAKLLYVNKIFKAKSLTESQKVQVIASFDKATTIKEAKVVFESLTTALTAPKKPLKESLGFASRAAGIAPRQQIVESNDAIARMQKLANIIK
jgi:hypothetical protein